MKRRGISMTSILILVLIGMVIVIMSASIMLFLSTYREFLIENARTVGRQITSQVSDTVSNYVDEIGDSMEMLKDELDAEDSDAFFDSFLKIRPDVVAITTYDDRGTLLDCRTLGHEVRQEVWKNLSWNPSDHLLREQHISTPHVVTLFEGEYPWVVTMTAPLKEENQWIALDISFNSISEYISGVGIGQHGYCFLMDENGNMIYHPQQQLIYSDLKTEDTEFIAHQMDGIIVEENVIYTVQSLDNCRWRVVGVSFVDELIDDSIRDISEIMAVTAGLIVLFALLIGFFLSRALSKPVRELSGAMRQFEADADHFVYQPVAGTREILALSDSFHHMVGRIQRLMEKVRSEEINLRKTELKALQAQINPHFLYNTLDSISWMCERGKNGDAVKMVNALARLFRISISRGHELIPIRSELMHAESYLQIQAYRYKSQFSYRFEVEESCMDYLCNKITLQPIIENAIYHGINGLVDEGEIVISLKEEGEDLLFLVEDNGAGMEPETVAAILSKERSDHTGIGIKNVNDRLKIYFGNQYGITIDSAPDEGTRVYIRMPKVREASQYEKI